MLHENDSCPSSQPHAEPFPQVLIPRNWGTERMHCWQPKTNEGDPPSTCDRGGPQGHEDSGAQLRGAGCDRPSPGEEGEGGARLRPHPAEVGLEGLADLLPLGVAAVRDDVDDSVLISS